MKASDTSGEDGNGGEEVGMSENNLGTMGLVKEDEGGSAQGGGPPSQTRGRLGQEDAHKNLELMGMFGANVWEGKY